MTPSTCPIPRVLTASALLAWCISGCGGSRAEHALEPTEQRDESTSADQSAAGGSSDPEAPTGTLETAPDWLSLPAGFCLRARACATRPVRRPLARVVGLDGEPRWGVVDGVLLRFVDGAWQRVEELERPDWSARDLWLAPDGALFVVSEEGAVARFDGSSWSFDAAPHDADGEGDDDGSSERVTGIDGSDASFVLVVFSSGRVRVWDGATWSESNASVGIYGLAVRGPGDVWIAAADGLRHSDAGAWPLVCPSYAVASVALAGDAIIGVGSFGSVVREGGSCQVQREQRSLLHVETTADGEVFATGSSGAASLLAWREGAWAQVELPTFDALMPLARVRGSGSGGPYFLGAGAAIVARTGTGWSVERLPRPLWVEAIFGSSATDVFAAPSSGLLHFDGAEWTEVTPQRRDVIDGIGFDGGIVYAITRNAVLRWDGRTMTEMHPTSLQQESIWGSGPDDVWIVGQYGSVTHLGSDGVRRETVGTAWLHCVHGFAPDDVYVAGDDGAHHWDGSSWSALSGGLGRRHPASCRSHVEALAGRPFSRSGYLAPTGEVFLPDGYLTVIRP